MTLICSFSNLFSKIINGSMSKKNIIKIKKSKKLVNILNLLNNEGLIKGFFFKDDYIFILLKYSMKEPAIKKIKTISKPSKRVYISSKQIYNLSEGLYVISTTKGFLTHLNAKKHNLGGELICQIF